MKTTPRKLSSGIRYSINSDGKRVCLGSYMGRGNLIPSDAATVRKLHLVRLRMSADGCYDSGGAYWGQGAPLYWAYGESDTEQVEAFFRAQDRADARRQARALFPNARFFN